MSKRTLKAPSFAIKFQASGSGATPNLRIRPHPELTPALGLKARTGKWTVAEQEKVMDALSSLPPKFFVAVANILLDTECEKNDFLEKNAKDISDLVDDATQLLEESGGIHDSLKGIYPYQAAVIAAYCGATKLPKARSLVSAFTYEENREIVMNTDPLKRDNTVLRAIKWGPWPLTESGKVVCPCNLEMELKHTKMFGSSKRTFHLECSRQECLIHFSAEALDAFHQMRTEGDPLELKRFPNLFCPEHTTQQIKVTTAKQNGTPYLKARCSFYSNEDGKKVFCVGEELFDLSSYEATGYPIMIIMDLLSSIN